ncbi:MAG: hypothetical protein VYD19_08635 [Myxococcota bacterium]|nr:hypothetical protein [Myxococcota bacterium]
MKQRWPEEVANDLSPRRRLSLLLVLLAVFPLGCAGLEAPTEGDRREGETSLGGKADSARGPIEKISCRAAESFVRRGDFTTVEVEALDAQGAASKNHQLFVEPPIGYRVVQGDKIIFDEDGSYTVSCCALDSDRCDDFAVQVGELDPAFSFSIAPFTRSTNARIEGRAIQYGEVPAQVIIDGSQVPVDQEGRFTIDRPVQRGLNSFTLIAKGRDGRESQRTAWTIAGPFLDDSTRREEGLGRVQVSLGPQAYPKLTALAEALVLREVDKLSESADFQRPQEGRQLGYQWVLTPREIQLPAFNLEIQEGPLTNQFVLSAVVPRVLFLGDAKTRFGGGTWVERGLQVYANFSLSLTLESREGAIFVADSEVELGRLELDIDGFPGFFETIIQTFLRGTVKGSIRDLVHRQVKRALESVAEGFSYRTEATLPAPLKGALELGADLADLSIYNGGLSVGLSFSASGEPEPDRIDTPGPLAPLAPLSAPSMRAAYEAQLQLSILNGLLYEAWRSGGLDTIIIDDTPPGADDFLDTEHLTVLVSPLLPPVIRAGDQAGEFIVEFGAFQADGVLEGALGVWNCSLHAGGRARVRFSGAGNQLTVNTSVESLQSNVLIAPAGLEREPVRRLLEAELSQDVLPQLMEILKTVDLPEAQLGTLGVEGLSTLRADQLEFYKEDASVSFYAELLFE